MILYIISIIKDTYYSEVNNFQKRFIPYGYTVYRVTVYIPYPKDALPISSQCQLSHLMV